MAFTIPPEVNLLGYSGSVLSLILEALKAHEFTGKLRIIKNLDADDGITYNPGLPAEILALQDLRALPAGGFLFSTIKPTVKQAIFADFEQQLGIKRTQFFTLVHPHALVASTTNLDTGIYLEPGVVLSPFARLEFGSSVNRGCTIGHHTRVGAFSSVNPGVHIAGHCNIGTGVSIGMGATIFDHVTIGANSIIGGGSVVNRDIPAGVVAYGNPCKVVRRLSDH